MAAERSEEREAAAAEAIVELELAREELLSQNEELAESRLALERQRARYRDLFDLAPDVYLVTDERGVILDANRASFDLLGVQSQFLIGKPLPVYISRDDRSEFRRTIASARVPERDWVFRMRARGGRTVDVSARVSVDRAGSGEMRWLLRDVTDERERFRSVNALNRELETRVRDRTRELEAALRRNEALLGAEQLVRSRLADLMARVLQGIVTVRSDLTIEYANRAAVAVANTPLATGEELPEPWPAFSLREFAQSLFTTQEAVVERHVTVQREETETTYTVRGLAARGASTAVIIVTDVTERERRERIQREFVTNAAHELQTPLAAIVSATDVLQAGAKHIPEQRDRFLGHVEREVERLVRLTRALLALARMQALDEAPPSVALDVRTELEAVAERLGKHAVVEVDCGRHVRARANRELLEQVLFELSTNAAKHAGEGPIELAARNHDGSKIEISVRDFGPGISGDPDRLFERFYRSRDGNGEGFGLGLAIVRQIVTALGGDIDAGAAPGGGTVMRFTVPRGGM